MALIQLKAFAGTVHGAIPEYMALLGRQGEDRKQRYGGEFAALAVFTDGVLVWDSGLYLAEKLKSAEFQVKLPRGHKKRRIYLRFYRTFNGRTFTGWLRSPTDYPVQLINGQPYLMVKRDQPMYPSPVRSGRRWAASQIKLTRASRTSVPKSSTLRPAYEERRRAFLSRTEIWNPNYSYTSALRTGTTSRIWERSWSGVRTPNFGKLKNRNLPVNPHSVSMKWINRNECFGYQANKTTGALSYIRSDLFTQVYWTPTYPNHLALARNNAIRNLINRANLGIDANLAQGLGELGKTLTLFSSNVNRIATSLTRLKQGNIPGAVSALLHGRRSPPSTIKVGKPSVTKSLASNWLELQYGWKPLLYDIEGSLKALSNYDSSGFVQRVVASGKAVLDWEASVPTVFMSGQNNPGYIFFHNRVITQCRFVLRFRISDPLQAFLAQTGFTNPVNLAWELLPFSFVVDWFLPIGPYLEALSAFDGLTLLDGSQTQFTRELADASHHNEQISYLNPLTITSEHSEYSSVALKLDRIKITSFPSPTFPELKNGLASNVQKGITSLALLKQVFGR
jgi:hypothetical protein